MSKLYFWLMMLPLLALGSGFIATLVWIVVNLMKEMRAYE